MPGVEKTSIRGFKGFPTEVHSGNLHLLSFSLWSIVVGKLLNMSCYYLGLIVMDPVKAKANYSRVCQLLVDKGGDTLRGALHAKHLSSTLAAALNANRKTLQKLRYGLIKASQWKLLFPASGTPDSNNFDITLLTILLRNICGLPSPAAGWNVMPPTSDTSISANIARIKIFRNEVYGHTPSAQLDDTKFETLWQEISIPLIKLGIPQQDIDELKEAPLSSEEESYIEKLKEWKELEDDLLSKLNDVEEEVVDVKNEILKVGSDVGKLRRIVENVNSSQRDNLAKFHFTGKTESLCNKFQEGTRQWFLDKVSSWFDNKESRVMILTAGPGVGKSVLSAKVCKQYQQCGQLAACHFCDFRNSDYSNPNRILQSLASHMCDNVEGFRDALTKALRRDHSRDSLSDAFRVLLNDPLHALDRHEPMLIVVDALDESKTDEKSEFLELISDNFFELPKWIKIFISSRPELQVRKKLKHLHPFEILPDDDDHKRDLKHFILHCLPDLSEDNVSSLISKCEGSFLYAYYLVNELKEMDLGIEPKLSDYVPKGISGFYEKQFKRLKSGLKGFEQNTEVSIFRCFVDVVAASKEPLPIRIILLSLGLSGEEFEIRETVIEIMSEILPLYEDCLTVYHKSLRDWLTLDGYEEHAFVANVANGIKYLWRACKSIYNDINSLRSVSDFQISSEKKYALENGGKYLVDVDDMEDFHWLLHVGVNFLMHEYCYVEYIDYFYNILRKHRSKLPADLYWRLIQLYVIHFIGDNHPFRGTCESYLHDLSNGRFEFVQNTLSCKNPARDILNEANRIWFEEVTNEPNSSCKFIANAVVRSERNAVALSPNNKLLACGQKQTVRVFELPSLTMIFELDFRQVVKSLWLSSPIRKWESNPILTFSPDSSYFLYKSIRSCVCIGEQKEVPFIPHGPENCRVSFSSCGTKLLTLEEVGKEIRVKVWDTVEKYVLAETRYRGYVNEGFRAVFSKCNLYILVWQFRDRGCQFLISDSATFELKCVQVSCPGTCLTHEGDFLVLPSPCLLDDDKLSINIDHLHLPTGERVVFANKACSKPFTWKDRKCVIWPNSDESVKFLEVYDIVHQEIIDTFQINCLPSYAEITYISYLGEHNFLICLDYDLVLVLSLEASSEPLVAPVVTNGNVKCCALSPDNLYVACCYENRILTIMSVDNRKSLQTLDLKEPPEACWWSKFYIWVVCKGVILKYPYHATNCKVLENVFEDCSISPYSRVLKFAEGVLVLCLGKEVTLKNCNEKPCLQHTLELNFYPSDVAISSDGCAVLLFDEQSLNYQLWEWEKTFPNKWKLALSAKLAIFSDYTQHFGLTGAQNSRRSFWLTNWPDGLSLHYLDLSPIDSPNERKPKLGLSSFGDYESECIYRDSNFLIFHDDIGQHVDFIRVRDGKISSSCLPLIEHIDQSFYLASQSLLLLVNRNGIRKLKIHNIENFLSS